MYEAYWRLDGKPFENTPDPKFLYYSQKHEEALMRLLYASRESKQGAVLTGEYGSGKTVLSRVLLQDLNGDPRFLTVLIVNPKISKKEFLKEILFQMGGQNTQAPENELELMRLLETKLRENLSQNKKSVLIIDEAQMLTEKELEEIRLLLNFPNQEEFLVTLILIGQSDLRGKIKSIEPLKQRLALRFHLEPLELEEVQAYVAHRLGVMGRREPVFSPGAIGLIHEGSQGIPRQINNICDYALLIGFSRKVSQIGVEIVEDCLKDLDLLPLKKENIPFSAEEASPPAVEEEEYGSHSRHFEEVGDITQGIEARKVVTRIQRPKNP